MTKRKLSVWHGQGGPAGMTFLMIFALFFQSVNAMPLPAPKPDIPDKNLSDPTPTTSSNHIDFKRFLNGRLDKPLNNYEVGLYREIFKFQAAGEWDKADIFIDKIDNPVLIGHVLIQRYLHSDYTPTLQEYQQWQNYFRDHPQSTRVDSILNSRLSRYENRATGTLEELRYFARGSKYISENYNGGERYEVNQVRKAIQESLNQGKVSSALHFFENHRVQDYIDPIDRAQILAEMAAHYLYLNSPKKAQSTALKALESSDKAPLAGWVMGLVSWINNDMATAAKYFRRASEAPYASPWMTSAAAYWAARAYIKAKDYRNVTPMLAKAVQYQRSFYGLLATKTKGYGYDFNWTMPELSARHIDTLLMHPVGARAYALTQVGQLGLAEEELYNLPIKQNTQLSEAAMALAHHYNLAGYAMRLSLSTQNPAGGYYDSGLFPVSSWTVKDEYKDQALLNAFIRQESRFRANARNGTGATGLMQVMPSTAAYITEDDDYKTSSGINRLLAPANNVSIGAAYLDYLLNLKVVNRDLFKLAVAYNAGPGKLSRWQKEIANDDPLLFIELLPSSETRAFVERVVTNYWIYQMQMGIEPATLLKVAEGQWPVIGE